MQLDFPLSRDLVLIGGGHTHALVLRQWAMNPLAGARVTVINPAVTAPYTGMLPGYVAGHYQREELDIDLARLARFAGARLVLDEVVGIGRGRARVQFGGPGGPVLAVAAGDAVLIPAGVGHCCIEADDDLSVVAAYPPGFSPDMCRQGEADPEGVRRRVAGVPVPDADPILGGAGGVVDLWHAGG